MSNTVVSLCAGAGGLDWGFHQLGYRFAAAVEISPWAAKTYENNTGVTPQLADVATLAGSEFKGVDLFIAAPPCQGFTSLAGRDHRDVRNSLLLTTARLVADAKPRAFVIENVQGLLWRSGGRYISRLLAVLRSAGLQAAILQVRCSRLGVAQHRNRLLIVGGRSRTGLKVISSLGAALLSPIPAVNVGDAILHRRIDLSTSNHVPSDNFSEHYKVIMPRIGQGQKLCDTRLGDSAVHSWDIPEVFGATTARERRVLEMIVRSRRRKRNFPGRDIGDGRAVSPAVVAADHGETAAQLHPVMARLAEKCYLLQDVKHGTFDLARKFNGRFRRLHAKGHSQAVIAAFSSPRNVIHPTENRALTVRECARLQGFPDDFVFLGPMSVQYALVANAFPPVVSSLLASTIAQVLDHRKVLRLPEPQRTGAMAT